MARRPRPVGSESDSGIPHIVELFRSTIPPIHPAGLPFIAGGLGLAGLGFKNRWIRGTGLALAGACAGFFRHPPRIPPNRADVVVAAADGQICLVDRAVPPPELGLPAEPLPRISIFLSVFDVHVQRVPVAGEAIAVIHRSGQFLSADRAEASVANERNSVQIRTRTGHDVVVVQIAGLIARRIICHAKVSDQLSIGDTYGLIRFGSRVDTYLPEGSKILVQQGQRAVGAETVLAELPSSTDNA
ncbi:phosphatidylserine decarboxylase [Mycobacteroides saopaulense]|uniref:Phosphatidylserine decarboxylase proenzyme n=1 Tax=Mycobacteroides saopaulense TaxID=1578165 RepID=A0ABX3BWD7_9MYCO|nr:phosphatidylserine decarboxylase [Mycobacteroides saopaulense]OHT81160.1 phosphatidylserine decarboxylase [Mycobacteroides saopaulense]OHU07309.1 phosphatidylserine decarboxylase [Mycobacteroides saopaulense]